MVIYMEDGNIQYCCKDGSINSKVQYTIGQIIGYFLNGSIKDCYYITNSGKGIGKINGGTTITENVSEKNNDEMPPILDVINREETFKKAENGEIILIWQ